MSYKDYINKGTLKLNPEKTLVAYPEKTLVAYPDTGLGLKNTIALRGVEYVSDKSSDMCIKCDFHKQGMLTSESCDFVKCSDRIWRRL